MELLSPAGNLETLKTAVYCGANAVYIGGKHFGARRNAANFTDEELIEAVSFCHLRNVKVYVTLNIMLKESEIEEAYRFAEFLAEIGVDGVIVQDLGLLCALSKIASDMKRNVSTQMTICSADGVKLVERLGANRVVLARELSKSEIESIGKNTSVELETFVHGAMCMSWSGQCQLSSFIGGRSGNRGLCAQPCRLSYRLLQNGKPVTEERPLLSMKDLCLAREMQEIKTFSDSAKIEGRMKSAEYTGMVTQVYKKAMEGTATEQEIRDMLAFFSRGGSEKGYYNGRTFKKMMEYNQKEKVSVTKEQIADIKQTDVAEKLPVSFVLTANEGEPLRLSATCDSVTEAVTGEVLEPAKTAGVDTERVKKQIAKLGDTPFFLENVTVNVKGNPFLSVSVLNGLRREVCERLQKTICDSFCRNVTPYMFREKEIPKAPETPKLCVSVRTEEQYRAAKASGVTAMYLPYALYKTIGTNKDICVLPSVLKEGETLELPEHAVVMVQNLGQIESFQSHPMCGGERLNVANSETISVLKELGLKRVTLSTELNLKELRQVMEQSELPTELIVYGRTPVMLLENCVIKSQVGCGKGKGDFSLQDRMGERFPLICEGCRNVMLNSVPTYMADKIHDVLSLRPHALRFSFTVESAEEVKQVLKAYKNALSGAEPKSVFEKITRGHFYRGVE